MALQAVSGGKKPVKQQRAAMLGPIPRGIGVYDQVLTAAGPQAQREMTISKIVIGCSFCWFRDCSRFGPSLALGKTPAQAHHRQAL